MSNLIFSDEQYSQLQQAYSHTLSVQNPDIIYKLTNLINNLKIQSFNLPLNTQNKVLNKLERASELLHIIYKSFKFKTTQIKNNTFELILNLCYLSQFLTQHPFNGPYQTIYFKSNQLIMDSILEIVKYFSSKL